MKVAVIGASGRGGSRIVDGTCAARASGHGDRAQLRRRSRPVPNITVKQGDVNDAGLADLLKGHDAVISAVRFARAIPSC